VAGSVRPEALLPLLRGRFGRELRYEARCPSTQRLLPDDALEGAVAVTDEQTEGRGRLGRAWLAPGGSSVLASVVLQPRVPPAYLPELSLVAGEACARAITEVAGVDAHVKHPNDVLVNRRKVAGILAEASEGRVVLGLGINVSQREGDFPERAEYPATSLLIETGRDVERAELLAAFLDQLEQKYDAWVATRGYS
jgi:BirA family biotin operon repressor/biotin-[acetyl-CoA-carboxylase] ligase